MVSSVSASLFLNLELLNLEPLNHLFELRRQSMSPNRAQLFHRQLQQRLNDQSRAADAADHLDRRVVPSRERLQALQIILSTTKRQCAIAIH